MKVLIGVLSITLLFALTGCAAVNDPIEKEKEVALSEVPAPALAAAKDAVKGFIPTKAEVEEEDGQTWYEIEGTVDGQTYEVEVTADGKVLEVEKEDD